MTPILQVLFFEDALERGAAAQGAVRAKALRFVVELQGWYGEQSKVRLDESLNLTRKLRDKAGMAATLNALGIWAQVHHDYEAWRRYCEESLAIFRGIRDKHGIAESLV